jgi:hypothetical protein
MEILDDLIPHLLENTDDWDEKEFKRDFELLNMGVSVEYEKR